MGVEDLSLLFLFWFLTTSFGFARSYVVCVVLPVLFLLMKYT